MNVFYIYFSATQMETPIDNSSEQSNHNKFIGIDAFTCQNMFLGI